MTVKKEELDGIKQDRMARMLTFHCSFNDLQDYNSEIALIHLASLQQELLGQLV